jgi:D-alanine-D-alanine ligase
MNIGFTYDLKDDYLAAGFTAEQAAECDRPDTIVAIERALKDLGHSVERIGNLSGLVRRLAAGARWDMVFNICEGMSGMSREAQVPALLDAYGIPYAFSDAVAMAITLDKGVTKRVVRDLGIRTADFGVVRQIGDMEEIRLRYPLFVKPVAEGSSKGVGGKSLVATPDALRSTCLYLLETFHQAALVEEYLPGREFTAGIIGTGSRARALGVMEIICPADTTYSFFNKQHYEEFVKYLIVNDALAAECENLALRAWRGLALRDCGRIDIRLDKNGKPNFIEVNPLPGLNPVHSDLPILCSKIGMDFKELIGEIVSSARERCENGADARYTTPLT